MTDLRCPKCGHVCDEEKYLINTITFDIFCPRCKKKLSDEQVEKGMEVGE